MIILIVIPAVTAAFFILLYALYYRTFGNSPARHRRHRFKPNAQSILYKDKIATLRDALGGRQTERVTIVNRQGMTLSGRYYHNGDSAPLVIMFHGYRSRALNDAPGGFKLFSDMGYNILLPDQRAHGDSEGRSITFGIKERYDCADWIDYANLRFGTDTPIYLVGVSMGAATVTMCADMELPDNVRGIIADCGYTSPRDIIKKVIGDMHLPAGLIYPPIRLSGVIYGGFDADEWDSLRSVAATRLPILIIHGQGDSFVPYEMGVQLKNAGGDMVKFLGVPGAEHGLSYIVDDALYTQNVRAFISENNLF